MTDMQIEAGAVNGHAPAAPRDNTFRPGRGGQLTQEQADYMLNLWWAARDKKLTFQKAVELTMVHFLVEARDE